MQVRGIALPNLVDRVFSYGIIEGPRVEPVKVDGEGARDILKLVADSTSGARSSLQLRRV